MRRVVSTLVVLVSLASPVRGQATPPVADSTSKVAPRWLVGLAANAGQPIGTFKRHVTNAAGAAAHGLLRIDRHGLAAIRVQGGWFNYGTERQRSCLGTTPGCRVAVDVTTANGILSVAAGPQVTVPLGPLRTYAYGLAGVSRFATVSAIGGGLLPDLVAGDENFGDAGLTWSGGVGLQWPVGQYTSVDVGVAYQGHGRRSYLVKGGVTDHPDGSLAFDIKRSTADLYAISVGLTTTIPWGRHTPQHSRSR